MSRIYFDRTLDKTKDLLDKLDDDFYECLREIYDEVDSLITDIMVGKVLDIETIQNELIGIRDRIKQ